ncbi:hypothetical protein MKW94_011699 [Papaver nudicaule]|uniref:Protein FAR1-RELATED SEQUENCE n=1 Tax=Papaver nudicaule TaxID=74823 RepID=A0AA41RUH9_PAPNU|nr:hypothetical protein [Papaver nudicaule]MCL7025615.1 hypothetical protein [Papaver nudicaule]
METISLFETELESFVRKYQIRYPEVITYLYDSVLVNKEYFAYAWTNDVKHFGIRTSNRVEGAHSVLKRFLGNSQGGFVECWKQMHNLHESQLTNIKAKFQQSLTFIKHHHRISDFKGLHNHVSQYALDIINKEVGRLEKSRSIAVNFCGCIIYKTHGLPCAHMIAENRMQSKPIPLSSIDSQWRQLNLVPQVASSNVVFDYLPQLQLIKTKWETSNAIGQRQIAERMSSVAIEILHPDQNNYQEPPALVRTKGRKTTAEKKKKRKRTIYKQKPFAT